MKRTYIYVDGFNLYYRLLEDEPSLKWLDLKLLFQNILDDENAIVKIRFFTARVSGRTDIDAPRRQQMYLSALEQIPEVQLHFGRFLSEKKFARLKHPPEFRPACLQSFAQPWPDVVKIIKTEEKGSDVNLACHLLLDAFRNQFDVAAVVSNDTDLIEPMRIAKNSLLKTVGLISPVGNPSPSLRQNASFVRHITKPDLRKSQFPDEIYTTDGGIIQRPDQWK